MLHKFLSMVPVNISDAIARGDRQAVKAWLNAEDSDVNSFGIDGQAPLGMCVLAAAQSQEDCLRGKRVNPTPSTRLS